MATYYIGSIPCTSHDVYHFGVKGMRWGKHLFGKIKEGLGLNKRKQMMDYKNFAEKTSALQSDWAKKATEARNRASNSRFFRSNPAGKDVDWNKKADYYSTRAANAGASANAAYQAYSKAKSEYGKTIAGRVENTYNEVMSKGRAAISKGRTAISKFINQGIEKIKGAGKSAITFGKSWLFNVLERINPDLSDSFDPNNPKAIYRQGQRETARYDAVDKRGSTSQSKSDRLRENPTYYRDKARNESKQRARAKENFNRMKKNAVSI